MKTVKRSRKARVVQVLAGPPGVTYSEERAELNCIWDGIKGDRHCGRTKRAGGRERYAPKGAEILNVRQISLVSQEELAEIATHMRIPEISGAELGANIVLEGIEKLTQLSSGTIIECSQGTMLFVIGENLPCRFPGENIQKRYPDVPGLVSAFPRAAKGRRGLVAIVLRPGIIQKDDEIKIIKQ